MTRTKVAHLSSVHPPRDPRIVLKECSTLAAAGMDVVYVCPHTRDENVSGVRVRAVPLRRGRLSRVTATVLDVWKTALRERPAIFHIHDPELLPLAILARFAGHRVVYDVHEDLPLQVLAKHWIPRTLRPAMAWAAKWLERLAARTLSGIVAATPQIGARFPAATTVVVQNFVMVDELAVPAPTPYSERPSSFVYIGGIAAIRGAIEMVAAIGAVPAHLGARLALAGPVSHAALAAEMERHHGWKRVDFHGWQSRAEVAGHLHRARAGILVIHPTENYLESYPVKLFEYMAVGLPVIVSDFPLWRALIGGVGCAIFVNPLDAKEIAAAMTWILEHPSEAARMGAKGPAAARDRFNWDVEAEKLLAFYRTLIPINRAPMSGSH
ncbi:MAG TPA: glycosyltransferase family 4 protein [Gemmatimonadaceae bacterium]|nr:glycosyltransferase family 4 protein [Gemmatimonadaceae bacterium]